MRCSDLPASNEVVPEDMVDEGDHDEYDDDSSIRLATVVKAVVDERAAVQNLKTMGGEDSDRGLVQEMLTEDDNEEPVGLIDGADRAVANQVHNSHAQKHAHTNVPIENLPEQGHGRRKKISNSLQILSAMMIMKTPISRCRIFRRFEAKKG